MRFLNGIGRVVVLGAIALAAGFILTSTGAHADIGMAVPGQMGFQRAATPVMEDIESFHNFLMVIITLIVLLVMALIAIAAIRFNRKANPVPTKTSHNTVIEVLWTVLPVMILMVIAIPSFRLLYKQLVIPPAALTIKATGSQWYWSYEYPDNGDISFDSNLVPEDELKPGQPRLLTTDEVVVVPVNEVVRVIVTGADVIHSWAVPAFGVKIDAIPGRLNETWFQAERTGTYYGQCSELCGQGHAFMPIEVKVVSKEDFAAWVAQKKASASLETPAPSLMLAQASGTISGAAH